MYASLMNDLQCPGCKGELELIVLVEKEGEIISGAITCKGCGSRFEIKEGIPALVTSA